MLLNYNQCRLNTLKVDLHIFWAFPVSQEECRVILNGAYIDNHKDCGKFGKDIEIRILANHRNITNLKSRQK